MASKKATAVPKTPVWLSRAMQGLVHWVGLKRAYYSDYKLTEGAIVDEFTNLLSARLGASNEGLRVTREYPVERLTGAISKTATKKKSKGKKQGRKPAVDFVVEPSAQGRRKPRCCIEVKRLGQSYEADLRKLNSAKKKGGGKWRAFALVIAQGERPAKLVTEKGLAPRNKVFKTGQTKYVVRRVIKAVETLKADSQTGYWACLLEVV